MALTGSQKAYKFALSNVARSGATRSGYVSGLVFIAIGGIPNGRVQIDSVEIVDELNETPNTCRFRLIGAGADIANGYEVVVTLGSTRGRRLFAGHVATVTQSYWEKPVNVRTDVACIDYTWNFRFPKVTQRYTNVSASGIVIDLISRYAAVNGFSNTYVVPNLQAIDEITFTNEDLGEALSRLANRIGAGAYWYVDYFRNVHFFQTLDVDQAPLDLVPTHPSLANVTRDTERSQALTRVYVEGRGSSLLSDVPLGDTMLPLETVAMFVSLPDVFLKASFQGATGGAQHVSFSGVVPGGAGTLVGPGIGPASAPVATTVPGTGVTSGTHDYAVTFTTAAGESLPGPHATAAPGLIPPAPVLSTSALGGTGIAGVWQVKISWFVGGGETLASAASNTTTVNTTTNRALHITLPLGPEGTTKRRLYFKEPGGPGTYRAWRAEFDILNNTLTEADWSAQMNGPLISEPTGALNQVNLTAIPIGAAAVTARKIYRTAANVLGPLKLLTTLANNTATTYSDTAADAALGATVPAVDTSGLQQPDGQILAGSPAIPVAGAGAFEPGGGWAIIGNGEQVIRYTSNAGVLFGGIALSGIPATGIGSITATIAYNTTITAAPMLTGIPASGARSLTQALSAGDEIYLVVQCDDVARQAQFATQYGGTGLREEWVQDRRLSIPEARARGNATLTERALDPVRVSYTCRDVLTRSGAAVTANLPAPTNLVGQFRIQHVVINNFRPHPNQQPTFTVQASNARFSFEDLLRLATRDVAR